MLVVVNALPFVGFILVHGVLVSIKVVATPCNPASEVCIRATDIPARTVAPQEKEVDSTFVFDFLPGQLVKLIQST
jgi:hypothetical protein